MSKPTKLTVSWCMKAIRKLVDESGFSEQEAVEDIIGDLISTIESYQRSYGYQVRKLEKIKAITEQI